MTTVTTQEELQQERDDAIAADYRLSGDKWGDKQDSRRPQFRFHIDRNPLNEGHIVHVRIEESMGHPVQYIELTSDEARDIACRLIALADYADQGID